MEGETIEHIRVTSNDIDDDDDRGEVETALAGLDGVRNVVVDPDSHSVDVAFDPRVVDRDAILGALEDDGYHVESVDDASPRDIP